MHVVIVGGGSGGIDVAARLKRASSKHQVTLIDPTEKHYYQPLWTLVGGGLATFEETERDESQLIPKGVDWIQEKVTEFEPDRNLVRCESGKEISYDQLVVAPGIRLAPEEVKGLQDALDNDPRVWTNYDPRYVRKGFDAIKGAAPGRALFTTPNSPLKCGGAPQKIMWVAEEWMRKLNIRDRMQVELSVPGGAIFGIAKYCARLEKLAEARNIKLHTHEHLIEVDRQRSTATFENLESGETIEREYSLLHVTVPQRCYDFVRNSPLATAKTAVPLTPTPAMKECGLERGAAGGFVEVDIHTLQHKRFSNVWSLGDAADLPTAKTGAAVRKQAPTVVANLLAAQAGNPLIKSYDGYTSCPLVVGHHRVILAEFGYEGKIMETFPFDQSKPRWSSWLLKRHLLPPIYWHGMLTGRM